MKTAIALLLFSTVTPFGGAHAQSKTFTPPPQNKSAIDAAIKRMETAPEKPAAAPKAPSDETRQFTAGVRNGRFWTSLGRNEKLYYLVGLNEGASVASVADGAPYFPGGASFGETEDGIDQFYAEPANARISVLDALRVFTMKVKGATPARLEAELATLRRRIAAEDEREKAKK